MVQAAFSSNGNYRIDIDAALQSQNREGNYSIIYWRILVVKSNAYGHMATTNMGNRGDASSNVGQLWANGNMSYEFRNGSSNGTWTIAEGTFRVNHNGAGEGSYYFAGSLTYYALGSASASTGWRSLPRLATEPPPPRPVNITDANQTSFIYRFTSNGDGGLAIREWQVGYGRNGSYPEWYTSSWGTAHIGGLQPATRYYIWARGRNDIGWSGWSARSDVMTTSGALVKATNGQWVNAVPYVKVNGSWILAQPYVKVNGIWVATS